MQIIGARFYEPRAHIFERHEQDFRVQNRSGASTCELNTRNRYELYQPQSSVRNTKILIIIIYKTK